MTTFSLELGWAGVLDSLGIHPGDLLRAAGLPGDLLTRPRPTIGMDGFHRLWEAISDLVDAPHPGMELARAIPAEAFSPPLFAAYCSPNFRTAVSRLALFKPLMCPMRLDVLDHENGIDVRFRPAEALVLPEEFVLAEAVFLVNLARMATRHHVVPLAVELPGGPFHDDLTAFLGRQPARGPVTRLVLSHTDASRAFLSVNPSMYAFFEPELRTRLEDLERSADFPDRLRAALMEALPAGEANLESVARRMGVSTRSLQRRLKDNGTSFKEELTSLRTRLAETYLADSRHSSAEISFLLGYNDPNSFIRAFHGWTGTTPEAKRARI